MVVSSDTRKTALLAIQNATQGDAVTAAVAGVGCKSVVVLPLMSVRLRPGGIFLSVGMANGMNRSIYDDRHISD